MAKSYNTTEGTLYIPGAYAKYKVESANSGLATTGVLMLVGEADLGLHWSEEEDLEDNAFGPDALADVIAKYGSGPLVDAFRAAAAPMNDPDIQGAFQAAILVKTNQGTAASGNLPKTGGGTYETLDAKLAGNASNFVTFQTTEETAEVIPTTGSFTFIPPAGTVQYEVRLNGGADLTAAATLGAACTPVTFVSTLNALAGVGCTGGADRDLIDFDVLKTLALDQNPVELPGTKNIKLTRSAAWKTTPTAGDTLVISPTSVVKGGADQNVGAYVILSATSTYLLATKLSDAGMPGAVPGTVTTPVDVGAIAEAADTDALAYASITAIAADAAAVIDGRGKSLEIASVTGGTDLLTRCLFNLGTVVAVSWVSSSGSPQLKTSAAEQEMSLDLVDTNSGSTEAFAAGGEIALRIGYLGTTATVDIDDETLDTTVAGGSGSNLSLTLADFSSIQALADFIDAQTGYSASVGSVALGQLSPTILDRVTAAGCAVAILGAEPCRIKTDAYRFAKAVNEGSSLVEMERADAGIPDELAAALYLTGGAKGGSTDAAIVAAIDALEEVRGNFVVPLFSRDATDDIADGLTDAASTYTIDAIHAAAKSHVLAVSTLKRRKNRQAFLGFEGSFDDQKDKAAAMASFRASMAFENFKQIGSDGSIETFGPWMGAVLAAAGQAAGFYRNIEFKGINTSGILHSDGSFNPKSDSQMEQALQAGLLPARQRLSGGFAWVSDQTTYGKDSNFVFNSIQAVYAADIIALTMAQRMETAFVGQSVADISASVAKAYAEGVLADFLRLKLTAPSDGAESGFKNLRVQIRGNAMLVSVEVKLATAIDFVVIDFLVSPVEQSA